MLNSHTAFTCIKGFVIKCLMSSVTKLSDGEMLRFHKVLFHLSHSHMDLISWSVCVQNFAVDVCWGRGHVADVWWSAVCYGCGGCGLVVLPDIIITKGLWRTPSHRTDVLLICWCLALANQRYSVCYNIELLGHCACFSNSHFLWYMHTHSLSLFTHPLHQKQEVMRLNLDVTACCVCVI